MTSETCRSIVDTGVSALAATTVAGLALETVRAGSALHPHWLGSTGSSALDATIAGAFATIVLARRGLALRAPHSTRFAAVFAGIAVSVLSAWALLAQVRQIGDGRLRMAGAAPPATLVALALIVPWTSTVARARPTSARARSSLLRLAGVAAAVVGLLFAHLAAVGATDYRGTADAILVFGAKVCADGRASGSLLDRTRTACALWREGLAPILVLSGGRDPAAACSEPEAMRRIARAEGVPESALVLDESGANTAASVRFVARLALERGWHRVLAVSHDYHLARVRLLAARAGLAMRTVPAVETCTNGWKCAAVPREIAAYAVAWARSP